MTSKEKTLLDCIEIDAASAAKRSIIWLHGLGADGSDFVPIVPELKLPPTLAIRFIFPHAPVIPITINNGLEMRAWYDIASFHIDQNIDHVNMQRSRLLVKKLIENEINRGIQATNIMLAGFSQGAVIALTTGLCYEQKLAGMIALSGYLPSADEILENASEENKETPIFLAHGTEDPIVPYALGKAAYIRLRESHYPVTWHSYPMPHSVCADEIHNLGQWLQSIWQ